MRTELTNKEAIKRLKTHLVGACEIAATRLAIENPTASRNCQMGELFSNTNMVAMPPTQLPTSIAIETSAK